MEEENGMQNPGTPQEADLGKFKSVDALARAYKELEAEFTRRSQRLKALEERTSDGGMYEKDVQKTDEEGGADEKLYRAVTENEEVRKRVVCDYLSSLRGVPLMTGGGVGVTAPAVKPKTVKEAGALALGYFTGGQK